MSTPFYTDSGAHALKSKPQYTVDEAREALVMIADRFDELANATPGGLASMYRARAKNARSKIDSLTEAMSERDVLITAGFIHQNLEVLERS